MAPNSWGQGREVGPLRLSISGGLRVVHGLPGVAVQRPVTGQNKSSITGEKPAVPDVGILVTTGRKITLSHKSLFVSTFCRRIEKRSFYKASMEQVKK